MVAGVMTKIKAQSNGKGMDAILDKGEESPFQGGDIWAETRMLRRSWPCKTTEEACFKQGNSK